MKFIDMHSHILPGIDDGAKDLEEAKEMLRIACDEGIRYIIATPHFHPKRGKAAQENIKKQLELLRKEAKSLDEKMQIFIGHEVYYGQDVPELLSQRQIYTMNLREYVLVEFSTGAEESYIKQAVMQLQSRGYKVILAHVERYECIRNSMELVEFLINSGVHFQVNAGSILGTRGREIKKFVRRLLEEKMVFCVGTDAHDSKVRPPHMKKAAHYVEKKYGEDYARRIFFSNAAMMLKKKR